MGKSKSKVAAAVAAETKADIKAEAVHVGFMVGDEPIQSLRDFGYHVAAYADRGAVYGKAAAEHIPGFPDNVSEEDEAEVKAGFIQRKDDLAIGANEVKRYRREGPDNWIEMKPDETAVEFVRLGPADVMNVSPQIFGSYRKSQPKLHELMKPVRDATNKYCSNRWQYLVNLYKATQKKDRTRDLNKTFAMYLDDTFSGMVKRNKTALSRGDTTAVGKVKLDSAIAAFRTTLA